MTSYARVKESRKRTAGTFPLPSPLDCIRYAICELAEYDDALLRIERTGDKRNNERTLDPRAELGQALYMLLSAAVQWRITPQAYTLPPCGRLHAYGSALSWLLGFTLDPTGQQLAAPLTDRQRVALSPSVSGSYTALCAIAAARDWDIDALVDETCAAFEAKHAPAREVQR